VAINEMFTLKEVFLRYTTSFQPSSPKSDLADFLISEELSRASLDQMCDLVGIKDISDIKSESMDLILHYIQTCLRDHELNDEELENIRVMKLLFRVKEGDFLSLKEEEVVQIVSTQFQMLIADREVTDEEELFQLNLRKVFGISYDQYLELTTPYVHDIVDEFLAKISSDNFVDEFERMKFIEQVFALDTFYTLTPEQRKILDNDLDFEISSRTIPQSVKDAVWRRDEGRCSLCGRNELLEFDHIIPYSKGGANTYRNIQLLCQECNREKADKI